MMDNNGASVYLKRLRWALSHLPAEDREEIVTETRAHFSERVAQGATVEEVAASFGEPEAYARRFLENYEISVALSSGSPLRMMGTALKAIGSGVGSFLAVTGLIVLYLTALNLVVMAVLKPIMPEIIASIEKPGWSVMFSNGVRENGLAFLAEHHIEEGLADTAGGMRDTSGRNDEQGADMIAGPADRIGHECRAALMGNQHGLYRFRLIQFIVNFGGVNTGNPEGVPDTNLLKGETYQPGACFLHVVLFIDDPD